MLVGARSRLGRADNCAWIPHAPKDIEIVGKLAPTGRRIAYALGDRTAWPLCRQDFVSQQSWRECLQKAFAVCQESRAPSSFNSCGLSLRQQRFMEIFLECFHASLEWRQ